jgi:hypothetical protein
MEDLGSGLVDEAPVRQLQHCFRGLREDQDQQAQEAADLVRGQRDPALSGSA